ncbi:MAG: glucokinase [Alphaproteobacteria bacterium]|nr:glucokinase [Alphaproteobacteria bacterium SS10]
MTDLIADIGATNARFALLPGRPGMGSGIPESIRVFSVQAYHSLEDTMTAYLDAVGMSVDGLQRAAICIAGPVTGDQISMTNHPWAFSQRAMRDQFGLEQLIIVNDFTAIALGLSRLKPSDRRQIGGEANPPVAPKVVLGPGTGLGVSGLLPIDEPDGRLRWHPLSGEGGHVTLPSENDREAAIISAQRAKTGHVGGEDFLCGSGLVRLYEAIATVDDKPVPKDLIPAKVTDGFLTESDPIAIEAVELFCGWLGVLAGNCALTLGATGGVYVAGGIVPRLGERFDQSAFRDRFEAKNRFKEYLAPIPSYVITHDFPAFLGLMAALDR